MLGDSELDELRGVSNKYTSFKTLLSGAKSQYYSDYSTPDINSFGNELADMMNSNDPSSAFDMDELMNNLTGQFGSAMSSMKSFQLNINNSNIKGNEKKGSLMAKLISLIMGIIQIPGRFMHLFKAVKESGLALSLAGDGIGKSIALGAKDVWMIILAIIKIIIKYWLCILNFIVTIPICFLPHCITFFVVLQYLLIMFIVDNINYYTTLDFSSNVDDAFEYVTWPELIYIPCYTCFGKRYKLRDIITDVSVIEDLGNKVSYDFNNTMPRYMKKAVPRGKLAGTELDKAIN